MKPPVVAVEEFALTILAFMLTVPNAPRLATPNMVMALAARLHYIDDKV
jgi:hypothetical protein